MDRLPRGRHGLSPEFVARNQRERLISALILTLADVGYQKTTVSMIGRRAAVSKSDFYKHFDSKDECFLTAYDHAVDRIRTAVVEACAQDAAAEWPARVRAGVTALLTTLASEPPLATIVLAEGLRAGRGIYDRYQAAVESFVPLLRDGAPDPPGAAPVPPATDEAVVGGVAALLGRRVVAGEAADLAKLIPDVLEFALAPHLGTEGARRIISAG
ncbi:MAG TPA: TetR/AcrR family transcriptional regulator [Solirubrobacterales bacterium]|jgi:AcrR family transcriptional regulator|nr:TetR/AcrR family transcriptional regulator [Solirubrobacterales bacterium]